LLFEKWIFRKGQPVRVDFHNIVVAITSI